MNLPKIIDNQRNSLLDTLTTVAPNFDELSIASGYWDLPGTQLILGQLKTYKKVRLMIGREPLIPRHQITEPELDYPNRDIFLISSDYCRHPN